MKIEDRLIIIDEFFNAIIIEEVEKNSNKRRGRGFE